VNEFEKIPGVAKAARVGSYSSYARTIQSGRIKGRFLGIDRAEFPLVAYWRPDFAKYSLGTLMNLLAASPEAILAPRSFLVEQGLNPGDLLELQISTELGHVLLRGIIVGSFDLFPGWYAEVDGPLFVGNLETVFDLAGGFTNYQVWIQTNPAFDYENISKIVLPDLGVKVLTWQSTQPRISQVHNRPEQQGVFGFLWIGFSCAAILSVLGFFLYALFSYRQRFIELGVLRALGLDQRQMAMGLIFELLLLLLIGSVAGTFLGIWSSETYIPYLQIGEKPFERTPPFQVMIDYSSILQIFTLFALMFLVVFIALFASLRRMKIFQAIKLGETL
jgi:putative ABC transport system permease protein